MRIRTTLQAAQELGVPEWRLWGLARTGAVVVPIVAGRRLWQEEHLAAARRVLAERGLPFAAAPEPPAPPR